MTFFRRLFPTAIGGSFRSFLIGDVCQHCDTGNHPHRWSRYDGTGSWRMHRVWVGPEHDPINDYDSAFCRRNGWLSRHWFTVAAVAVVALIFVIGAIGEAFSGETAFPGKRCNGGARYEAMSEGADCFNPPLAPRNRPSCWAIRSAVHHYGEQFVEELARSHGASEAEIQRGKRCLKD